MPRVSDPTHEPAFVAPYRYARGVKTHIIGGIAFLLSWTGLPLLILAAYSVALIKTEVHQLSPPISLSPTRDQLRRCLSAGLAVGINSLPALLTGAVFAIYSGTTHTEPLLSLPSTPLSIIGIGSVTLVTGGCIYTAPAVAISSVIHHTPQTIATEHVQQTVWSQSYASVWMLSVFVTGVVFASTLSLLFIAGIGWILAPVCIFYWFCTATLLFTRALIDATATTPPLSRSSRIKADTSGPDPEAVDK